MIMPVFTSCNLTKLSQSNDTPGASIYNNKHDNRVILYRRDFINNVFSPPTLLHPLATIAFSKVNKSVVSTGLRTDQKTTKGSPPEISSVVRRNEHQGRSGCSDTGPCYSFEVSYTFIFSLLTYFPLFWSFFLNTRSRGSLQL